MIKARKLFLILILGLCLASNIVVVGNANATANKMFQDSLQSTGKQAGYKESSKTLSQAADFFPDTIGSIIKGFIVMIGVLFLVLAIYGGYKWMLSRGNESEVAEARNTIQEAVIGLVIVVAAYAITAFIGSMLSSAT